MTKKDLKAVLRMYNALLAIGCLSKDIRPADWCLNKAKEISDQCLKEMNSEHTRLIQKALGIIE